jgi:hypothetical protein
MPISKRQNMTKGTTIGSEGMPKEKEKQTQAHATTPIDIGTGITA